MKKNPGLNFYPESYSPIMERKFRGLQAAFSAPPISSTLPTLQIGISYAVDDAFVESLGGKKPAEALILTVINGYATFSENILGDALLFEDDYRRHEKIWFGHLNLRLAEYLELRPESEYYLTISMGTLLSNNLRIPRVNSKSGYKA